MITMSGKWLAPTCVISIQEQGLTVPSMQRRQVATYVILGLLVIAGEGRPLIDVFIVCALVDSGTDGRTTAHRYV